MRETILIGTLCLLAAGIASAVGAGQKVRIVVKVPDKTPAADSIYLAGSLPSVGRWKPDGVKLTRQPDGTYTTDLELEPGQTLEFKITRGNWETVEKLANGGERENRSAKIDASTKQINVKVERWASGAAPTKASTVVGTLKLHEIESKALKRSRTIRVWLPANYDADPTERFDVLYMHDGQNCFDRATSAFGEEWAVDETLTKLIAEKKIPPLIVVGIDNGLAERISEYTYAADPKHGGGRGAEYARFLLQEVKPLVETSYRVKSTKNHTYIAGSSLGGLISLEIARRHPDTFGGVIAMSSAIWWAGQSLIEDVEKDAGGLSHTRIWLDMGSREAVPLGGAGPPTDQSKRFVEEARRLAAALTKHKIEHRLVIDDKHPEHNERAWAQRFPDAITYLLNAK